MIDPFYATIKLTTGEEILSEVCPSEENGEEFYLLSNPVVIEENNSVDIERGISKSGLVPKKWMMYSNDDLIVLRKDHVITMSQLDKYGEAFYIKALYAAKAYAPIKREMKSIDHSGYLGSVAEQREFLERLYKDL